VLSVRIRGQHGTSTTPNLGRSSQSEPGASTCSWRRDARAPVDSHLTPPAPAATLDGDVCRGKPAKPPFQKLEHEMAHATDRAVARRKGYRIVATPHKPVGRLLQGSRIQEPQLVLRRLQEKRSSGNYFVREWVVEVARRYRNEPAIMAWQQIYVREVCSGPDGPHSFKNWAPDVSPRSRRSIQIISSTLGQWGAVSAVLTATGTATVRDIPTIDLCEVRASRRATSRPSNNGQVLSRTSFAHSLGRYRRLPRVGLVERLRTR